MTKQIIISERDNIAAVLQKGRVEEFFVHRGDILIGDIYLAKVQNVLPSIDAAFVDVGSDKMGFIHASDLIGKGSLTELVKPNQTMTVQVVKEPTGHKGPRVTTAISLPGRFLVLMPYEKGINVSKKIASAKERARLKSVVSVLKPPGLGVIIRTEAEGQSEAEIQEDLELLLEKWQSVVTVADTVTAPNLLLRDQDLLYKVIREACTEDVSEIVVDTPFAYHRAQQLLQSWNMTSNVNLSVHKGKDSVLIAHGVDKEIKSALQTKINLPSGGYLYIQITEALTVIDVNSGKFVSSATQEETIRKTNLESAEEIARQLRLRNIGGMIIVDFIDMDNRADQIAVLEQFEIALEPDKSKPQIGQISDLGLVELTRHRQGQSLVEIFTKKCPTCSGSGSILEEFNFVTPPQEAEQAVKAQKLKQFKPVPQKPRFGQKGQGGQQQQQQGHRQQPQNRPPKRIETNPALNAANAHKIVKQKPEQEKPVELNDENIKKQMQEGDFIPETAKNIRIAAVPPEVAKKNLGKDYQPDVFTVLEEMEGAAAEAQAPAPAPKPAAPKEEPKAEEPKVEEPKEEAKAEEEAKPKAKPRTTTRKTTTTRARKPRTTTTKRTTKTTKKTEE